MKYVHPFPARMAPELALEAIGRLTGSCRVLDPMMGSGTVLEEATKQGHHAVGFDVDPLALLMTSVRLTKKIDSAKIKLEVTRCITYIQRWQHSQVALSWIDKDEETLNFVNYWFGPLQVGAMRALARYLSIIAPSRLTKDEIDLFRLGLSKIVIVKTYGASLAWDISHSRPHRKIDAKSHDFDVASEFERAVLNITQFLSKRTLSGTHLAKLGDARSMLGLKSQSIDLVVTSPPYFNAIDYMRGHRLALVWLGFQLRQLRAIRSDSVGAERALGKADKITEELVSAVSEASIQGAVTTHALERKLARYSADTILYLDRISRVLKKNGEAVFVVGNCRIGGTLVDNSRALEVAAGKLGFNAISISSRELPDNLRYLPTPSSDSSSLFKRMRQESVIRISKGDAIGLSPKIVKDLRSSIFQ